MEAHPRARWITLEQWKLTLEFMGITLKEWKLTPGAVEPNAGVTEEHPRAIEANMSDLICETYV
jgi:formylmethanofuran dehydrogenase subunit A